MDRERRKPDGTWTDDPHEYCEAWRALYEPVCEHFGLTVIGYDPGIRFADENRFIMDLPVWFLTPLVALIEAAKKAEMKGGADDA